MKTILRIAAIALIALTTTAAAQAPRRNWTAVSAVTSIGSHVLGNPDAEFKLVEYVSYTCSHCAEFQKQAEAPLRMAYVTSGRLSVEVRNLVRDPVDLAAALLTHCGDPARFFRNHNALLIGQDRWIGKLGTLSDAQQARWSTGPLAGRMRAIASDLGFYPIMVARGYERPQLDRCLADDAMARRLVAQRDGAAAAGVTGTPSFLLQGVLLEDTHDWKSLDAALKARF